MFAPESPTPVKRHATFACVEAIPWSDAIAKMATTPATTPSRPAPPIRGRDTSGPSSNG